METLTEEENDAPPQSSSSSSSIAIIPTTTTTTFPLTAIDEGTSSGEVQLPPQATDNENPTLSSALLRVEPHVPGSHSHSNSLLGLSTTTPTTTTTSAESAASAVQADAIDRSPANPSRIHNNNMSRPARGGARRSESLPLLWQQAQKELLPLPRRGDEQDDNFQNQQQQPQDHHDEEQGALEEVGPNRRKHNNNFRNLARSHTMSRVGKTLSRKRALLLPPLDFLHPNTSNNNNTANSNNNTPISSPQQSSSQSNQGFCCSGSSCCGSCCCWETTSLSKSAMKLLFCFVGLQFSYLSWAYLQEVIMTTQFNPTPQNPSGRFPSASFCVFCNRCVALTVASMAVKLRHGSVFSNPKTAPLRAYVPCAISNTLSSISQYASLKYVSFPVMTVFKSSTIIPVMIMGYLIRGATYHWTRYVEAFCITAGVAIFSLYSHAGSNTEESPTGLPLGMLLLTGYVIFDSFTTQWQGKIYSTYGKEHVDSFQMMLGVDTTAILFTTASLLLSGEIPLVVEFFHANPHVMIFNLLCPIMSTCGQLFIFFTIKEFGPVVFTIIMTTRKLFSICISAMVFGHSIDGRAAMGGVLVLAAIAYSVKRSWKEKMMMQQPKPDAKEGFDKLHNNNNHGDSRGDENDDDDDEDDVNSKNKKIRAMDDEPTAATAALAVP